MTYAETLAYMESLKTSGIRLGLERMQRAADAMGNPERAYDVIHIAGTNGKGSTASMIAAVLANHGHTVGSYTSPVVTDLRDTICVNGHPVDEAVIAAQATLLRETVCDLSEFEWCTLLTFCVFRALGVTVAVIECGLGGETDATNIIPSPLCAVLTPIASDHAAFLGNTVEEITAQKCGIIKNGCHVVCAPTMAPDALGVIFEHAAQKGATVHLPTSAQNIQTTAHGSRFDYGNHSFQLCMPGEHQIHNALTALCVLECLRQYGYRFDPHLTASALSAVVLPCRQEWVEENVLLDGAHNPHGINALASTLQQLQKPVTLVIGMLKDKDFQTCLKKLAPFCERIIGCTPHSDRAVDAEVLCDAARRFHNGVTAISEPIKAYQYAKKITANNPIVVGGSFYTASVVRRHIKTTER